MVAHSGIFFILICHHTTHKLVYYGQKSILCRIQTWTRKQTYTSNLFDPVPAKTVNYNDFLS